MPLPTIDFDSFAEDVKIDDIDLNAAFRDQAGRFAEYAVLSFNAMRIASDKKVLVDVVYSKLDRAIRDRVDAENAAEPDAKKVKKITEAAIEAEISRTADYVKAKMASNEADAIEALSKNALEAFRQRRDMLVQLGASEREELKGELRMKAIAETTTSGRDAAMATLKTLTGDK